MSIVVFGATGYTGRLVVAELAARGARPTVAGRSADRLRALADEHGGLPTVVADSADPASVRALVSRGDVLVSTVGPFLRHGAAALDAAVDTGAHYVDSTGEAPFVRRVFTDAGPRAEAAGCALLTAFGFDFVPGNLAGALALGDAGSAATRLEVGYFVTGTAGMSSGTKATGLFAATSRTHRRDGGRLVERPYGRDTRVFVDGGRRRTGVLFGGTEPLTLPRLAPGLTEVSNYLGIPHQAAPAIELASYALPLLGRVPVLADLLNRKAIDAASVTGQGPSAERRAGSGCVVLAVASDAAGNPLAGARLRGPDPYDLTARLMADVAMCLDRGEVTAVGALGPVEAYGGVDRLEQACAAAGLVRVTD
jgi:short subunit dehydrogenase-like uncharacterized protein